MVYPDYEQAKRFALHRLKTELAPELMYHSLAHTTNDVLPAVVRLAAYSNLPAEECQLLQVAAAYHDIGFLERRQGHEEASARIVEQTLPRFGFRSRHIQTIVGLIMATRLPQSPTTYMEEILADADLDVLGRHDFFIRNHNLRLEMATQGYTVSNEEWYREQVAFLEGHSYFTTAARASRRAGKARNLALLHRYLLGLKAEAPGPPHPPACPRRPARRDFGFHPDSFPHPFDTL